MRRREFVAFAGAVCAAPSLCAQSARGVPRVGFVLNSAPLATMQGDEPTETVLRGFLHGLRALGYVEGKSIVIERRSAEGRLEKLEAILRELAQAPVDVIVVTGNPMALAARKVTSTLPIVAAGMGNPIKSGIVQSLARPGGNITGLVPVFGPELGLKRLELIREMLPGARRIAVLDFKQNWDEPLTRDIRKAGSGMGLLLSLLPLQLPEIEATLAQLEREPTDALYVPPHAEIFVHVKAIAATTAKLRIPDFHGFNQGPEAGGLVSYGHDAFDIFRRAAGYVDRILKGTKPAEMPIEQMDRYSLVLNLNAAKALGLTIPMSILLRADRVIK